MKNSPQSSVLPLQIRATTGCPPNCQTCAAYVPSSGLDLTNEEIEQNILHFKQMGVQELVFSGLEITLRKDFARIAQLINVNNFNLVTLLSSGLHWTPRNIELSSGVLDRVVIAFTPISAADLISDNGPMAKKKKAINALLAAGIRVETNTILQKHVIPLLPELTQELRRLNIRNPTLTFPFGLGKKNDLDLSKVPKWEQCSGAVFQAVQELSSLGVRIKNVPVCHLGEYATYTAKTTNRILVEPNRQLDNHAIIPPFVGLGYGPECEACPLQEKCDGYWQNYKELDIMPAPVNSCNTLKTISAQPLSLQTFHPQTAV